MIYDLNTSQQCKAAHADAWVPWYFIIILHSDHIISFYPHAHVHCTWKDRDGLIAIVKFWFRMHSKCLMGHQCPPTQWPSLWIIFEQKKLDEVKKECRNAPAAVKSRGQPAVNKTASIVIIFRRFHKQKWVLFCEGKWLARFNRAHAVICLLGILILAITSLNITWMNITFQRTFCY